MQWIIKVLADAWEGMFGSIEYELVMKKIQVQEIAVEWEDGGNDNMVPQYKK